MFQGEYAEVFGRKSSQGLSQKSQRGIHTIEMHKSHYYLQRDIPVNVVIYFEKD